jgi:hypothetical protein
MPLIHTIHIPSSSTRSYTGVTFVKLLRRVDPRASNGFGFEGIFLRPGGFVEGEKLWPDESYPRVPVLLECAGNTGFASDGRKAHGNSARSEVLFVLWKFNLQSRDWIEVARAKSDSAAWACELAPIAGRVIQESLPKQEPVNPVEIRKQIVSYLSGQLDLVSEDQRQELISVLHDEFACRLAKAA